MSGCFRYFIFYNNNEIRYLDFSCVCHPDNYQTESKIMYFTVAMISSSKRSPCMIILFTLSGNEDISNESWWPLSCWTVIIHHWKPNTKGCHTQFWRRRWWRLNRPTKGKNKCGKKFSCGQTNQVTGFFSSPLKWLRIKHSSIEMENHHNMFGVSAKTRGASDLACQQHPCGQVEQFSQIVTFRRSLRQFCLLVFAAPSWSQPSASNIQFHGQLNPNLLNIFHVLLVDNDACEWFPYTRANQTRPMNIEFLLFV